MFLKVRFLIFSTSQYLILAQPSGPPGLRTFESSGFPIGNWCKITVIYAILKGTSRVKKPVSVLLFRQGRGVSISSKRWTFSVMDTLLEIH